MPIRKPFKQRLNICHGMLRNKFMSENEGTEYNEVTTKADRKNTDTHITCFGGRRVGHNPGPYLPIASKKFHIPTKKTARHGLLKSKIGDQFPLSKIPGNIASVYVYVMNTEMACGQISKYVSQIRMQGVSASIKRLASESSDSSLSLS